MLIPTICFIGGMALGGIIISIVSTSTLDKIYVENEKLLASLEKTEQELTYYQQLSNTLLSIRKESSEKTALQTEAA